MSCDAPSISPGIIEVRKHFLVAISKYRGSIYALSMSAYYPKYTQRIPNASLGLIFQGDIFGRIFGVVYRRGLYLGAYTWGLIFRILWYKYLE